jgi:hypothetical protein
MFLDPGLGNTKLNRENRRIYNNSWMPPHGCVIYSRCNKFPAFPISDVRGTILQDAWSPLSPRRASGA